MEEVKRQRKELPALDKFSASADKAIKKHPFYKAMWKSRKTLARRESTVIFIKNPIQVYITIFIFSLNEKIAVWLKVAAAKSVQADKLATGKFKRRKKLSVKFAVLMLILKMIWQRAS